MILKHGKPFIQRNLDNLKVKLAKFLQNRNQNNSD